MNHSGKFLRKLIEELIVIDKEASGIRKTDEYNDLECFCSDNPPGNDFERLIRGCVFDGDELIIPALPYAKEYKGENINLSDFKITTMVEGTTIRCVKYKDEWLTTTHKKLNAFKSKWGKEPFGEIFANNIKIKTGLELHEFYETLNEKFCYIFLVGTTDTTRTVCPKYDGITLLACLEKNKLIQCEELIDWYPKELQFESIDKMLDYVKFQGNSSPIFENGYGLYLFSEVCSYKIINEKYEKLSSLRNNLPSISFAYLHNVFDEEKKNTFRHLYPKFQHDFDNYDSEIRRIAKDILHKYIRKFIKKENITVSKQEQNILYNLHGIYLRTKIPINIENVFQTFAIVPASNINRIIAERKLALKKEKELLLSQIKEV